MKKEYLDVIEAILSDEYARGYNDGTNHGIEITEAKDYEQGLNDAWECARSVVDCKVPFDFWELASGQSMLAAFKNYSAKGAIEKIREYEEKQNEAAEIKIGDEVTDDEKLKGIVTYISPCGEYLTLILEDGTALALRWRKADFKKTGRHFPQIEETLKQMQEEE